MGLPEGVPSSACLSDIFLEDFDRDLQTTPDVIFAGRYVDDIIVVTHDHKAKNILDLIDKSLNRNNLARSAAKTTLHLSSDGNSSAFDYLGYGFNLATATGHLETIDISQAKLDRYSKAIDRFTTRCDRVACWSDGKEVDLIAHLYEYLLRCHETPATKHQMRIVTGLAYSARLVAPYRDVAPRFQALMNLRAVAVERIWDPTQGRAFITTGNECSHCARVISYKKRLLAMKATNANDDVLRAGPLMHASKAIRSEVRRTLWS